MKYSFKKERMKTKFFNPYLFFMCFVSILFFSCQKSTEEDTISNEMQVQIQSDDAEMISSETESIDEDASTIASSNSRFSGIGNIFSVNNISADIDTTNPGGVANRITINYNGRTTGCRKRTGSITIELLNATRWIEAGATLKMTFNNFKVENICRNKSVAISGERFITNVNGGNLFRLANNPSTILRHKVKTGAAGITATFTDSLGTKTANWNLAKLTNIGFINLTNRFNYEINGDTTINGKINTESWGTTRFGKTYQTVINVPIKANSVCQVWRPTSGTVTHTVGNVTAQVHFGLNAIGNPVGGNDCAGFFKITVTPANGNVFTKLIPYR
jgi:hypothetical protein